MVTSALYWFQAAIYGPLIFSALQIVFSSRLTVKCPKMARRWWEGPSLVLKAQVNLFESLLYLQSKLRDIQLTIKNIKNVNYWSNLNWIKMKIVFLHVNIFWLLYSSTRGNRISFGCRQKQDIWGRHLGLWEAKIDVFHHFLPFYRVTTSRCQNWNLCKSILCNVYLQRDKYVP